MMEITLVSSDMGKKRKVREDSGVEYRWTSVTFLFDSVKVSGYY